MKNLQKRLDFRLEVVSVVDKSDRVEFVAFLSSSSASCPQCGKRTLKRHSTHIRKFLDLPLEARQVDSPCSLTGQQKYDNLNDNIMNIEIYGG